MATERSIRNILITGGAGFIGSAFIRYVLKKVEGFDGVCVNYDLLTYAGNLENLREVSEDRRYVFQKGDIRDEALVEATCKKYSIDTIIHFAAESHVDRSIEGPQAFMETNVMGTFHLLEVVRRMPHIHFHHVSTDEVYGCLSSTGYFTEETPYKPNSPYSASKAASDHLVRAYGHTYALSTCISNCSNNYGPYHFPEKLIPLIILNCLEKKPLPVYGEGVNIRDWLYVEDHAAALWLLLNKGRKGETYNIGGESERRNIDVIYDIIHVMSTLQGKDSQAYIDLITFVKDRPGHDFRYAIDCTKIQHEIGWRPSVKFEEGIRMTVSWFLSHLDWVKHIQTGEYRQWMEKNYAKR